MIFCRALRSPGDRRAVFAVITVGAKRRIFFASSAVSADAHCQSQQGNYSYESVHVRHGLSLYKFCRFFKIFTKDAETNSSCVNVVSCIASSSVTAPQLIARRK